ncbi:hypothetical protein CRU98_06070 [Arcobacter sp. CECT 8986]|uniref:hypothetical protein n=1 Tax=Arcobacter sp. CECT 8986 TaxID=2044507 RepID=UPI001009EB0A|nr:hypothetical protein [Arcobacter sp. CECT 8986]RXJ99591.1 hypothetical protein CRU98_06070 [Arcobacter sp. CECT 8986]
MLRLSLIIALFLINANAIDLIVTKKVINYKAKIDVKDLMIRRVDSFKEGYCTPIKLSDLNGAVYQATHYIKKGSVICTKDIKEFKKKSVVFKFGALEIETNGEIIYQNDEYIRIKRRDGKVEKIYKDGRAE